MTNSLFNSTFEMSLRILLLLSSDEDKYYSAEKVMILDFINCYSADYNLPYPNLHGKNKYKFGELANRRNLTYESIRSLVTKGLIKVEVDNGYKFSITDIGKKYVGLMESDYAEEYKKIALASIKKYGEESDGSLLNIVRFSKVTKE